MPGSRYLFRALFLLVVCAVAPAREPAIDFNGQVRPIFVRNCLACHGGVKQAAGLSLVTRGQALAETESGAPAIEPGEPDASYLLDRVSDPDDATRMPPPEHGPRLTEAEVAILRAWIAQGALWEEPWAFRPPTAAPSPQADSRGGARRIDRFVRARLEAEGLRPAPEADRAQWLRRVSFDLIGLPPTEAERTLFETDHAPDAHDRVIDRLLASPHFGERWASVWLDLARYADTVGFERDPPREIWPWRDWVVRAFNADLPYDEFLLKQFAGDLLPGATIDDRLATAFHRNTPTNTEGGTDDEEYRWAAVVDRVDSTWHGVLGMTMACARCHDHPYDPLTQEDYYRFAALLNTTTDADLSEDWPALRAPTDPARGAEADALDAELAAVRLSIHDIGHAAADRADPWRPIDFDSVASTRETRLEVRTADGGEEVVAVGTVSDRSTFTLVGSPAEGTVAAVRLDALPLDPERARRVAESGFVVSRLRLFIERAAPRDAERGEAPPSAEEPLLVEVVADQVEGFFPALDSLRDTPGGWGAYTRFREPRWAVFVLDSPVTLGPGDRLRLEVKHDMETDGQGPLVIPRLRVSTTADSAVAGLASDRSLAELRVREEDLLARRGAIPATPTPVLVEQAAGLRRVTYLFERGSWLAPTREVEPGVPGALPGDVGDRRELGRWLGSDENPLTARVLVNRVWAELFGVGLVDTVDDFGSTGADPTHPELLDDLAARFRGEMGWSLKRLLREVALSGTYRQDARASAELVRRDPTNRLLARGPRGRLRAEMVRDQALVLSGRFSPRLGGPPVMPYQPDGVWRSVHSSARWETSTGADRYRRALYTYWKRTSAYPSMVAFDAPSREQCTARRPTTNTPLQALVTLNDPAFVDLAEGLAARMLALPDAGARERIAWAGREATGRPLADPSLDELVRLYDETLASLPGPDEKFATTVVANVLLNLDAALTK